MCDLPNKKLQERWKQLLKHLIFLGIGAPNQCDKAMAELKVFKDNDVKKMQSEFSGFSSKECGIDDFYFRTVDVAKYKELSFILKFLLTRSHGQAAVQRGFTHNNAILKTNMSHETVLSERMIKDHMLSFNLEPHAIEITNPFLVTFRSSRQRNEIHLEEEKKKKQGTKTAKKAMHIAADIDKLKRGQLERSVEMMEIEFVECIKLAEDKDDMAYVHKGIGLKRKSIETKDSMKVV